MTTEPSTGACRSPRTSSSENSTAAMGVLNAAASAAAASHGHQALHAVRAEPEAAARATEAMPAPICTEGLRVPSAMPLASEMEQQRNLPMHGPERDVAVVDEHGEFGLRDAAAARIGEVAKEQVAGDERSEYGEKYAPPGGTGDGVHAGGEAAGQQDECDNDQADKAPMTKLSTIVVRASRSI